MATGIVAIAASRAGVSVVSWGLFQVTKAAYAVLWLLTLARLVRYGRRVIEDLTTPSRGAGFLTMVAATSVLGSQFVLLSADRGTAQALWALGIALWVVLTYAFFGAAAVRHPKPALEEGLDGGWLLVVVATQSVSLLGTLVAPAWGPRQPSALLLALALHLLGCAFYVPIIVMIGYRLLFRPVSPAGLTAPYWIAMGAVAISALAGALLVAAAPQDALLRAVLPVLQTLTLSLWVVGTWWIPLLVILGAWRHGVGRVALRYDPEYWAMVFPLGMYAVCTFEVGPIAGAGLQGIARSFLAVALAAWAWAFAGLVRGVVARFFAG